MFSIVEVGKKMWTIFWDMSLCLQTADANMYLKLCDLKAGQCFSFSFKL